MSEDYIKGIIFQLEELRKISEEKIKEIWSISKQDLEHLIETYNELKLGILLNLGQEGRRIIDEMPDVKPLGIDEVFAPATGERKLTDIIAGCSYAIGVLNEISKKKIPVELLVKIRRLRENLKLLKINENLKREISEAIESLLNGFFLASSLILGRILKAYLNCNPHTEFKERFENFVEQSFDINYYPKAEEVVDTLELAFKIIDKLNLIYSKKI